MEEQTYTLEEAKQELAAQECTMNGHRFTELVSGAGEPIWILCTCCNRRWAVADVEEQTYTPAIAKAMSAIEALNGVSFYEEDGGLIDMGDAGYWIARDEALAVLAKLSVVPSPPPID